MTIINAQSVRQIQASADTRDHSEDVEKIIERCVEVAIESDETYISDSQTDLIGFTFGQAREAIKDIRRRGFKVTVCSFNPSYLGNYDFHLGIDWSAEEPDFASTKEHQTPNHHFLVQKLYEDVKTPSLATEGSGGFDLYAPEDILFEEGSAMVETGLQMAIPDGFVGLIVPRSGLGTKHGIGLANTVGVIDSDYRDEVKVFLESELLRSVEDFVIKKDERFAQMIIVPVHTFDPVEVDELPVTKRTGGFGSTGA